MSRPAKTLREAAHDLTLMSDDGSEYEHNEGCQGEPDCPACWVEGIRQLFVDFPEQAAPVISEEALTKAIWDADSTFSDLIAKHLLTAGVFRDEATVKADALREAAEAQRQLARDARTSNGKAEHEDRADWLDDRANTIDPRRLEGVHP